MKRHYLAAFLIWLVFAGVTSASAAPLESRVALVIGNAAYRNAPPLRNPVNDARDMGKALKDLGFEVIRVENGSKKQLESAIGQFSAKLTEGSVGLFFYSGHGMQMNGHNYLIPIDAELANEASVLPETVDVDAVLELMNLALTRVNLVILDACRINPFERRFRGVGSGLAAFGQSTRGTLIAYSTSPGKVASDGEGANGLYTGELLKAMRQPGLTVEQVFKSVRIAVSAATKDNQTPWETSSLTGDFYFGSIGAVQPGPVAMSSAGAQQTPPAASPAPQTASLLPPTGAVNADEIPFHCPRPGTVVEYNTGAILTFSGEDGFRCAYSDGIGKGAEKFAAFADDAKLLGAGLDKLWPLKLGRESAFSVSIGTGMSSLFTEHFTVLRRETLTVPAGTFETVVIEWQELSSFRDRALRLFWYAPDLGLVLKSTVTMSAGGLLSPGLAAPSASGGNYAAVRIDAPGGIFLQ